MSDVLTDSQNTPMTPKADVLEFLKNNADDPDILEALLPEKKRPKRGEVADFQSYMIDRLKTAKEQAVETTKEIIESSRANMNNQARIHGAVLRLLEARNFEEFIHAITIDLATIFDVDIAVLVGQHIRGRKP